MIRVCCFCESWESGGIESFLHNVISRLDPNEFEVDIVASKLEESVFTAPLEAKGVRFIELSGAQHNILKNGKPFKRLLAERTYSVVHLNVFQGLSLYYARLARQAGIPTVIAHSHNTDLRQSRLRSVKLAVHRLSSKFFAKHATDLWACSKAAAEFMFPPKLLAGRGCAFIPNGIETERFRFNAEVRDSVRAELGITDKLVIGNVGRLCRQKNQSFLLDVLTEAKKRNPNAVLLLIGEGEDRAMLEAKAEQLGIADSVIFYGTTDKVERLLWAMDVFAFPSLFEGLGIVAVEAQAAGLSVVCSEHVPNEATVTDRASTIPLIQGVSAWSKALLQTESIRTDPTDQVRDAGFDVIDVAKKLENFFKGDVDERSENISHHPGL